MLPYAAVYPPLPPRLPMPPYTASRPDMPSYGDLRAKYYPYAPLRPPPSQNSFPTPSPPHMPSYGHLRPNFFMRSHILPYRHLRPKRTPTAPFTPSLPFLCSPTATSSPKYHSTPACRLLRPPPPMQSYVSLTTTAAVFIFAILGSKSSLRTSQAAPEIDSEWSPTALPEEVGKETRVLDRCYVDFYDFYRFSRCLLMSSATLSKAFLQSGSSK